MTSPVKLSRERWEMLWHAPGKSEYRVQPNCHYESDRVTMSAPVEIDGITFLPAEYVPAETAWRPGSAPNADGSRSQYHGAEGS